MCNDQNIKEKKGDYYGASIKDGKAHDLDHAKWSRRQFLMSGGVAGLGSMLINGNPLSAFYPNTLMNALSGCENDRVLVMLRLFGGNDGLNTVIPHTIDAGRDFYTMYRPTLALGLNNGYNNNTLLAGHGPVNHALHEQLEPLMPLWNNGQMSIVHNVGYPRQNFSHFTSSNLWASGANNVADHRYKSGWMGRNLDIEFPSYFDAPPTVPPALQIGFSNNQIFKSPDGAALDLVFRNPTTFYSLAQSGKLHNTIGFGDCPQDQERLFLRQTVNNSFRYSEVVSNAYNSSTTKATYPPEIMGRTTASDIDGQLQIVARLIKGQLGTKVYMVYVNGFDNHASQADLHPRLLAAVGQCVAAFFRDLKADGFDKDVTIMTFSEFGRTIVENGSEGTDHGNMSPMMLFGPGVNPGFHGEPMDLSEPNIERFKRAYWETQPGATDYRSVYGAVLKDWMGLDSQVVQYVLGEDINPMPNLFLEPCEREKGLNGEAVLLGHRPTVEKDGKIEIRYAVDQSSNVWLKLYDRSGQKVADLERGFKERGTYTITVDPNRYALKEGAYYYKLDAAGKSHSRKLLVQ